RAQYPLVLRFRLACWAFANEDNDFLGMRQPCGDELVDSRLRLLKPPVVRYLERNKQIDDFSMYDDFGYDYNNVN
ncbi:MAG TPA: hypothetical protein V6C95_14945, partial [Coleofasciculaceae cyanobacterium]